MGPTRRACQLAGAHCIIAQTLLTRDDQPTHISRISQHSPPSLPGPHRMHEAGGTVALYSYIVVSHAAVSSSFHMPMCPGAVRLFQTRRTAPGNIPDSMSRSSFGAALVAALTCTSVVTKRLVRSCSSAALTPACRISSRVIIHIQHAWTRGGMCLVPHARAAGPAGPSRSTGPLSLWSRTSGVVKVQYGYG